MQLFFLFVVIAWLFVGGLIPILNLRLLDHPNKRSSHIQPTPRGGGVAFVALACASSCLALMISPVDASSILFLFAFPLAVVGFFDDCLNLPASWRYITQLITAALMLGLSPVVQSLGISIASGSFLLLPLLIFLVFAVTAVINFTNFMDGLDGLVAGCMAVSISALSLALAAPWPFLVLVASLLGFLVWNWSPAKVFMGDVGSTFLGAVFAGLVLQASSWSDMFCFLLVATPLLADACFCVPRRFFAGQSVFQPHRLHLFQRLNQAGWSHARVSLAYISATAVLACAMLNGGLLLVFPLAASELLIGFWLDQRVAVPFEVASRR